MGPTPYQYYICSCSIPSIVSKLGPLSSSFFVSSFVSILTDRNRSNTTHDGPLSSTISALTFASFQQIAPDEESFNTMLEDLDQWINGNSTRFPTGNITPLQKKQYEIQRRWIDQYQAPGMEFVMGPQGGLTRTPANDTSYIGVSAVLQHPFARGSVVRVFFSFIRSFDQSQSICSNGLLILYFSSFLSYLAISPSLIPYSLMNCG